MDVVELASRFVRANSPSGSEAAMADAVEGEMRRLGFEHVMRDHLGSVIGVVGPDDTSVSVLFDGHMDVVPVVGKWSVDPFGAEQIGTRLYGRGSTDMKGGLAAAIVGVSRAAAAGRLRRRVAVSATVLEETIEGVALGAVLDRVDPESVVICEPSDLKIQIGQRGRIELLLSCRGVPAHAAYPERGTNPILAAAHALVALQSMSPTEDAVLGRGILVPTDVITDPYPSISMIPGRLTVRFDRRTLIGETAESVLSSIQNHLAQAGIPEVEVVVTTSEVETYTRVVLAPARFLPAWGVHSDHMLVCAAEQAAQEAGIEPRKGRYGFCTNGSESAGVRGLPTIGFGPGREEDAHIIDESIAVPQLRSAASFYEALSIRMSG